MAELTVIYRWMMPDDGVALRRLHRRSILLHAVRSYCPAIAHSWAEGLRPEGYAQAADNGQTIEVAVVHGAVVGFCGVKGDEIKGLYIDPAFTRLGIASGLMARALERIWRAGHDGVRVTAALSGVPFYESVGFRPTDERLRPTRGGLKMAVVEMARP